MAKTGTPHTEYCCDTMNMGCAGLKMRGYYAEKQGKGSGGTV